MACFEILWASLTPPAWYEAQISGSPVDWATLASAVPAVDVQEFVEVLATEIGWERALVDEFHQRAWWMAGHSGAVGIDAMLAMDSALLVPVDGYPDSVSAELLLAGYEVQVSGLLTRVGEASFVAGLGSEAGAVLATKSLLGWLDVAQTFTVPLDIDLGRIVRAWQSRFLVASLRPDSNTDPNFRLMLRSINERSGLI